MDPLTIAGLGAGLVQGIGGFITGAQQKKQARRLQRQADREYAQAVGYANQGLGLAKGALSEARNQYNGRMAGSAGLEANIYQNAANTSASVGRNATDASQALALAGAIQGQSNDAFGNLAGMEAQDKQRRFGDVQQAQAGVQGAYGNLQNLSANRSGQLSAQAAQLGAAGGANQANALAGIANTGMMAGMGMFGDLSGGGAAGRANPQYSSQAGYGTTGTFSQGVPGVSGAPVKPFSLGLNFSNPYKIGQ